jgi:hypothetical protein
MCHELRFVAPVLASWLACSRAPAPVEPARRVPEVAVMMDDKIEVLKDRLGWEARVFSDDGRGVALAWATGVLQPLVGDGWRMLADTVYPYEPGEAKREWVWGRGDGRVVLAVFVSSVGAAAARERLLFLATETTMDEVMYVAGPTDLGDVATISPARDGDALLWAASNVCVWIRVMDASGVDVLAIARGVQALIDAHMVADVAAVAPRIEGVTLSARQVEVGEPVTIELRVRGAEGLLVDVHGLDGTHRFEHGPGLTTTLSSRRPGPHDLAMMVADPVTLLSDSAAVAFLVTPPADP